MKVSFILMSQKGYEVLKFFINNFKADRIGKVITSRDNNVQCDYYTEIFELCKINNVECYDRQENYLFENEYVFAISWRWMLKVENCKLIIFHDSLLPRYKGFSPLVSCLINHEKCIGVTALYATENYDEGDIIRQESIVINYPIKIQHAIELISDCYCKLVYKISESIFNNEELPSYKQNKEEESYSLWRDEEDYLLDWNNDASYIKRFIDAVGYPYNGASAFLDNRKVRIYDATIIDDVVIENRVPGKVIFLRDSLPVIVCGKGLLRLNNIVDEETKESLLPPKKFRWRFK